METREFEKQYFTNLIEGYVSWEVEDCDLQAYFEDGMDYMNFDILFANDSCIILDAGKYPIYIEWGVDECPVYVDLKNTGYTRIGRVRNSRFWALANRCKNHR